MQKERALAMAAWIWTMIRVFGAVVVIGGLLGSALNIRPAAAAEMVDTERIVTELKSTFEKSFEGINTKVKNTKLIDRYQAISEILDKEHVDKRVLMKALSDLEREIDEFIAGWDKAVTAPLDEGIEAISKTIARCRSMLANARTGKSPEQTRKQLENYDVRLADLAVATNNEKDPARQARLRRMFEHTLAMRKLIAHGFEARPGLNTIADDVHVGIIENLASLESALSGAVFQVEHIRLALANEKQFVRDYIEICNGLVTAEDLVKMLTDLKSAGVSMGAVSSDLNTITGKVGELHGKVSGYAAKLSSQVADEVRTVGGVESSQKLNEETDREIAKYAAMATSQSKSKGGGK